MQDSLINTIIVEHLKSVEFLLAGFNMNSRPERIHKLRVEIKKIKAFISLLEFVNEKKYALNNLRLLFRKAGAIRDFQLNIKFLQSLPQPPFKLIATLKKKKTILKEKFVKSIPLHKGELKTILKEFARPISFPGKKATKKYFLKIAGKSQKHFDTHKRPDMHKYRKDIKKLMFVFDIIPEKTRRYINLNDRILDKLQDKVGKWHDSNALIGFLDKFKFEQKEKYLFDLKERERKQFKELTKRKQNIMV